MDWFVGLLVGWLVDWLVEWLVSWLVVWLVIWLVGCMIRKRNGYSLFRFCYACHPIYLVYSKYIRRIYTHIYVYSVKAFHYDLLSCMNLSQKKKSRELIIGKKKNKGAKILHYILRGACIHIVSRYDTIRYYICI